MKQFKLLFSDKTIRRIQVDDKERARLKSKGQNCKEQMNAANWPVNIDLLIGFMEAQIDRSLSEEDKKMLRWQLEEIAKEIL